MRSINDAPPELADAVREFFPESEWDNAVSVSYLESSWQWTAEFDSTSAAAPCGATLDQVDGVRITTEHSVGWFQINACNFPTWRYEHLFNTRHNVGTAHMLWAQRGWSPWYFSAKELGLL